MRNPFSNIFNQYSKKVGLPPGTLIYAGEKRDESTKIVMIDYNDTHFQESIVESIKDCVSFRDENKVTWIHIQGIHQSEIIEELGKHFQVNSLILEDIMNPTQLPKIEIFDDYIFILVRTLRYQPETFSFTDEPVNLIVGEHYVISFQESGETIFNQIQCRIKNHQGRIRRMPSGYLAYVLIDIIVDNYFMVIEQISDQIELLEEEVINNPSPEILKRINHIRRQFLLLRKPILPLRDVVAEVLRDEIPLLNAEIELFFRDVYDHLNQIMHTIDTLRISASGLFDTYSSALNHKMNEVMKVLTLVATFFIPLTFIAGLYGMNFKFMPELGLRWGYPIILLVMVSVGLLMFIYFKKKRWF